MLVKDILQKYNITQLRKIVKRSNITAVNKYSKDDLIKEMMKPRHKGNFIYLKSLKHDSIENRKKNIALVDKDLNVDKEKRKVKKEETKKKKAEELRAKVPALTERKTAKKAVKISQFGPDKPPRGKKEEQKIKKIVKKTQFGPDKPPRGKKEEQKIKKIVKKTQFGPDKPPREKKDKPSVKKLIDLLVPKDKRAKKTDKKESLEEKKKLLQKLKDIIKKTKEPPKKKIPSITITESKEEGKKRKEYDVKKTKLKKVDKKLKLPKKADKDVKKKKYIEELKELGKQYQTKRRGFTAKDPLRLEFKKIDNLLGDIESKNISKKVKSTKDIKPPKKESEINKTRKLISKSDLKKFIASQFTVKQAKMFKEEYEPSNKFEKKYLVDIAKKLGYGSKAINKSRDNNYNFIIKKLKIDDLVKKVQEAKKFKPDPRFTIGLTEPPKKEEQTGKEEKVTIEGKDYFTKDKGKTFYTISKKLNKKRKIDTFLNKKVQAKYKGIEYKEEKPIKLNNEQLKDLKLRLSLSYSKMEEMNAFYKKLGSVAPSKIPDFKEITKKKEKVVLKELSKKKEEPKKEPKKVKKEPKKKKQETIKDDIPEGIFDDIDSDEDEFEREVRLKREKEAKKKKKKEEKKKKEPKKEPAKQTKKEGKKPKFKTYTFKTKKLEDFDVFNEIPPDLTKEEKKDLLFTLEETPIYTHEQEVRDFIKNRKKSKETKKETKKETIKDDIPEGIFDEIDSDEDEFEREVRLKKEKEKKKKKSKN